MIKKIYLLMLLPISYCGSPLPINTGDGTNSGEAHAEDWDHGSRDRRFVSDTAGRADVLVLDVSSGANLFLTDIAENLVAYYATSNDRLEPQTLEGNVPENWFEFERSQYRVASDFYDTLTDAMSQLEGIKAFKRIKVSNDPAKLKSFHAQTVIETLLYHAPSVKIVYADDFQEMTPSCATYSGGFASIKAWFEKIENAYGELIHRHQIKIISRSMARQSKRHAEFALRDCDNLSYEAVALVQTMEQQVLDNLSKKHGVLIVNAQPNNPEPRFYYLDGQMRENPVQRYRSKEAVFVGYTNRPDIDFFENGNVARRGMIVRNQHTPFMERTIFIDGNLDEDKLNQVVDYWFENSPDINQLYEFVEQRGLQWWNDTSFRYLYGQRFWSPLFGGNQSGTSQSGMATSWATPIATSLILKLSKTKGLNPLNHEDKETLKSMVVERIFEPTRPY